MKPSRIPPVFLFCLSAPLSLFGQDSEVPGTVAKGCWLLESDSLVWSVELHTETGDGYESRSLGFGDVLLSTGLGRQVDLQFAYSGWLHERSGHPEDMRSHTSSGSLGLRMKWAAWGEDGKGFAVSVLPYLSRRVHEGGRTAHGLILPWSLTLSDRLSVGGQFGAERHGGESDDWWVDSFGNLYVSCGLNSRWSVYLETRAYMPCRSSHPVSMELGPGLLCSISEKLSLDLAVYAGLQQRASDWTSILRLSWRL